MSKKGHIILTILKVIVLIWDFLTRPIYDLIDRPWEKRKAFAKVRARAIRSSDHEVIYESEDKENPLHLDMVRNKVSTMDKVWKYCVKKYGVMPILGTREVLGEEDEVQSNGKIFKKLILGDYRWVSYEAADRTSDYFGRGLRSLGMAPRDKICIFADTRAEWMLSAQACFKHAFPLVTLYTNLGEDAVVHGVNQTKVSHVLTSHELLPKFRKILLNTPTVTTLIFFEDQVARTDTSGFPDHIRILPFYEVVRRGKTLSDESSHDPPTNAPTRDDNAIIMFTSGSTGVPKGVMLTHKNLVNTLFSFITSINIKGTPKDAYLAYLPLAHVLELISEMLVLVNGVRIGYSNPNTMINSSSMVKKGQFGDAIVLKPTIMGAVPLILDRIYKGITDQVARAGPTFQQLFTWAYNYRLEAIRRGESTPILNFFIYRKIHALLGGNVRLMFSGGAPLSPETQDFIRVCVGAPVLQGYGLTETNACATLTQLDQITTGIVGPPNPKVQIKLINWEEGNYRVTDLPRPRGEVVIGGNCVAAGYYEMPEKTAEDFYDEGHRRWFKTGDIAQVEPDGSLKIIDRKKDLVKLQFGEYVSLGKVESVLKTCPLVENICVYGDSFKSYCVAIVCPVPNALKGLAVKFGKADLSFEELCQDRDVTGSVLREIINHGNKFRLQKFEIPGAVTLTKEIWDPNSGLVTAALKIKRKELQDFYQPDIDRMYGTSSSK